MRRKRRRNKLHRIKRGRGRIRCRIGGKKRTWSGCVREYGRKRALKMWRKARRKGGRCSRRR